MQLELYEATKMGNFLYFSGGGLVLDHHAMIILKDLISTSIELLPIEIINQVGAFYLVHVLDILDCLDYEHSVLSYYESSGRLAGILKYEFRKVCIGDRNIFALPEDSLPNLYVTDLFKSVVEENKLEGVNFILRWEN